MSTFDNFKDISVRGRIAYGTMCAENYILAKRPEQNWSPVFKRIWSFSDAEYWDDWHDTMVDILPECLLEFPDFASSDFEVLAEQDYEEIKPLYEAMPEHWGDILNSIFAMEEAYAYSTITGSGKESIVALENIIRILESEGIDLPNIDTVSFSLFSEEKGWGMRFDCKPLSKIIC